MWVLTVDQEASRTRGDRVDVLLEGLGSTGPLAGGPGTNPGLVRPFERTAGDEVQAVLSDPRLVVDVVLHLLHIRGWTIGIGAGPVDEPLPATSRAGTGSAFVLARSAVEAAKSRRPRWLAPLAVRGVDESAAEEAEGVLVLLGGVAARRSDAGRAVVERVRKRPEIRQEQLAAELEISQQAVSARLRAAMWAEENAAIPAVVRLLRLAAVPAPRGSVS